MPEHIVISIAAAAVVAAIFLIIAVACIFKGAVKGRRAKRLAAALCAEYDEWRRRFDATGEIQSVDAGLQLEKGEECLFAARAILKEPRSVRVSTHSGYGVRPMGRVGVFEGRGTSTSHDEWQKVSDGVLYITNKRVVFAGDMHNRVVMLADMIAVETFVDAIGVQSSKRQKTMRFCCINGQIAAAIVQALQSA